MITNIYRMAEKRKEIGEQRYGGKPWPPDLDEREAALEALQEIVDAFNYLEILLHKASWLGLEHIEKVRADLRMHYEGLRLSYPDITDEEIMHHKRKKVGSGSSS